MTDALNAAVLNLSTLSLGPISLGGTLITPNSGSLAAMGTYSSALDLRPTTSLIVGITAALNSATNVLTWTFTAIDPATGQPTTNPTRWRSSTRYRKAASLSLWLQRHQLTGTQITNTATVVFDANAPINTPELGEYHRQYASGQPCLFRFLQATEIDVPGLPALAGPGAT